MAIGICVDSGARLPASLAERFRVAVVPNTVLIGDCEYLDGVDLDADEYHVRSEAAATSGEAVVATEPSSGQFALAYDDLVEGGCTQILSIHASGSGGASTANAARLAARSVPVPVKVVECAAEGFGVACCAWAAGIAIQSGAGLDEAAAVVEATVGGVSEARLLDALHAGPDGVAVRFRLGASDVAERRTFDTVVDAVNEMSAFAVERGERLLAGVGTSAPETSPIGDVLASSIGESSSVLEVVRFRLGPTIGAEWQPGAVVCVTFALA